MDGDSSSGSVSPMLDRAMGEENRAGCEDGGGVMLDDRGGGETNADLLALCADLVRAGGGVEGI